ncbi:hypothetical protein M1432_01230 [Patescibacteria group bacterium]|nr:hypothetical protein [Patescibacteria group bacterium]
MTRIAKQIIYGIFFIAVIGLVAAAVSGTFSGAAPAACAGDCGPAGPAIVEVGTPVVMKTESGSFLAVLVEVKNSSADYGVSNLDYSISLTDGAGRTLAVLSQSDDVLPGEDKYLLAVSNDGAVIPNVAAASFSAAPPAWQPASAFPSQPLSLSAGPAVSSGSSSIAVTGAVKNGGGIAATGIKALVLVFDKYQNPLFGGETVISIPPFGETGFTVDLPADLQNVSLIDPARTKIYLYQ